MKRLFFLVGLVLLIVLACNKSGVNENSLSNSNDTVAPSQRSCAANDVLEEQMKQDPSLKQRMDEIEAFTRRYVENPTLNRNSSTITIPVVVNVLYKTNSENISAAQINSQITALNDDYSAHNSDYNNTPSVFQSVRSGDIGVSFVLSSVVRKATNKKSWQANDAMKKSQQGGIDPTDPAHKLNIWVCTLSGGLLGYAQFPGGNLATDGVVILNTGFGTTGTAAAPFDKGRTATHEIGHWMNLRHIWGDTNCGNDFVDDTPIHTTYNFGCPSFPDNSNCGGTTHPMMTMNYMDYTDDGCMFMFTQGQKSRMLAVFAPGGPRQNF